MANVLVIGGSGFIGSHLIDSLVKRGHNVTSFSRLNGPTTKNLKHLEGKIQMIDGDYFNDQEKLENAVAQSEFVFHMGSAGSPADPSDIQQNMQATFDLIETCAKHRVKFIYPSSGGTVYGNQTVERLSENSPTEPISLYGDAKKRIEQKLIDYKNQGKLDSIIFRISNPFGPRQNPYGKQGLIPIALQKIREGHPIEIFGDGNSVRDYIYVTDLTELMASIFNLPTEHTIYNVGSGNGHTINDILEIYRQRLGLEFEVVYYPARGVDVLRVVLDPTRVQNEFGFEPKVDFVEGIVQTYNYIRELNQEGEKLPLK